MMCCVNLYRPVKETYTLKKLTTDFCDIARRILTYEATELKYLKRFPFATDLFQFSFEFNFLHARLWLIGFQFI